MSLVHEALLSQRQVWRQVSQRILSEGLVQELPAKLPKRIFIFGVGSSYFAAKLSTLSLLREFRKQFGTEFPVHACSSVAIGVEVFPKRGDWAFGLSHRGKTPATLRALEFSHKSGAFTAWVTAQGGFQSSFAKFSLFTSPLEKCEPHTVGMTSAICAMTTLFLKSWANEKWTEQSEKPNPDLRLLSEQEIQVPSILVGEWEGEWIAREIRLKFIEMAKVRPVVFGSEEFFHGPQLFSQKIVEGKRGFKENIWCLAMSHDSRAHEFSGGRQFIISGEHSLSWISSLVELQWLVLAVALKLGQDPDG